MAEKNLGRADGRTKILCAPLPSTRDLILTLGLYRTSHIISISDSCGTESSNFNDHNNNDDDDDDHDNNNGEQPDVANS